MMHKIPRALLTQVTILKSPYSPHRIYLIGTVHVSKKSCESVRELIEIVKPRSVFLEICEQRINIISNAEDIPKEKSTREMLSDFAQGHTNLFTILYSHLLHSAGKDLEAPPGGEFRAGAEAAKLCNASIVLGDREVGITVQRVWKGMSGYTKVQILFQLLFSMVYRPSGDQMREMVEELKDKEHLLFDMIIEIGTLVPWFVDCIIFERDLYMLNALLNTIDEIKGDEACDVVAVVGAGHVPGITERWNMEMKNPGSQINKERIKNICKIPGPTNDDDHITVKDLR